MSSAPIEGTTQRNLTLTQPGSIEEKVNYCSGTDLLKRRNGASYLDHL